MIFRQFCESEGSLGYLVADPVTREAVVVDPVPGTVAPILTQVQEMGLGLKYILETHVHQGHPVAALAIKNVTQARVVAHEAARSIHIDLRARDGDVLYFGEETLRVLHTPGHSPCAATYWWQDRLFTGETLLAAGIGGCDPQGGDLEQLYHSIRSRLLTFPGEYLIYPGRECKGRRLSSIEELVRRNAWFRTGRGLRAFVDACRRFLPNWPGEEEGHPAPAPTHLGVTKTGEHE